MVLTFVIVAMAIAVETFAVRRLILLVSQMVTAAGIIHKMGSNIRSSRYWTKSVYT